MWALRVELRGMLAADALEEVSGLLRGLEPPSKRSPYLQ